MGLLFKTTLVHIKKNSFVVFVLSFFVSSGIVVLSSSDMLRDNLNKGFQEVNYDGNPHDLILLSKSFKSDRNLNVLPAYENKFAELKLTPRWGYRWAFEGLKGDFYIKASEYEKIQHQSNAGSSSSAGGGGSPSGATNNNDPKLKKLHDYSFYVPISQENNYSGVNFVLNCANPNSFIPTTDAKIVISDYHKMGYTFPSGISSDLIGVPEAVYKICSDGTAATPEYFRSFMNGIVQHYVKNIANDSNTNDSIKAGKGNVEFTMTRDELYELHRAKPSFNPSILWYMKTNVDAFPFMKMWEPDHYLTMDLPLKILMANSDLGPKFRSMIQTLIKPKIYFKLDETLKHQINYFKDANIFNKVAARFWISGLTKSLSQLSVWIPMIPGLTYYETLIMLLKMFLWKFLSDETLTSSLLTSSLLTSNGKFDPSKMDAVKQEFKDMMNKWNTSIKGIDSWNPFYKFVDQTKTGPYDSIYHPDNNKYTNSEDFVFSTLRPSKTLSEYKQLSLREDEDWDTNKADTKSTSTLSSVAANLDSSNLISAVKTILNKWIDGDYYSSDSLDKTTVIPAFRRTSKQEYDAAKASNGTKAFSDEDKNYRNFPDTFQDFYRQTRAYLYKAITSYLVTLSVSNLKLVKRFIHESEIFTLSFLLQNFAYDPNKSYVSEEKKKKKSENLDVDISISIPKLASNTLEDDTENDYSPLLNYHKSAVVTNSGSTSAKLNDPSKLWHSYKVIVQERKDDAYVNRIKILSGNALFEPKMDFLSALTKMQRPKFEYLDFFNVLKRMKYRNPFYADVHKKYAEYFENVDDEKWLKQTWMSWKDQHHFGRFHHAFKYSKNNLFKSGARITAMMDMIEMINFTRTFKIYIDFTSPQTEGYIDQFSAYFAVVSPFYAEKNNIKPISNEKYLYFKDIVEGNQITQEQWEKEYAAFVLDPSNHDHIVNVNGNKLIVVGIGMSPDMLLPTHSYFSLVPNKEKEGLIFVDRYGYDNIKHNSLSTWDEYYLSLSYPQAIKNKYLEQDYKRQLFDYISEFVDGNSEQEDRQFELKEVKGAPMSQLVFLRSQYVDRFMFSVSALFTLILSFMGLIIFFTVWILVKRYITASINTFGVCVANGISKLKIILNTSAFIFVPAIIGVMIGYFLALGIQPFIFSLISEAWYLTPIFTGFSMSSLLHYALFTLGILGPISWICSWMMMRGDVNRMMKMNLIFKHNWMIQCIYKHLSNLSSLWKFRLSVILNTMGRGLILSSATIFLFVFTSFLFNNFGQFQRVSDSEIGTKDYGFSIAFDTPTLQSGQPQLISYANLGDTYLDKTPHKKTVLMQESQGKWKDEVISFDHQNPEIVGSGLKNYYSPQYIFDYVNQCKTNMKMSDWKRKLGILDFDYPGNALEINPYNMYLFGQHAERKKEGQKEVDIDCSKTIEENYTISKFDFVPQNNLASSVFGKSKGSLGTQQSTPKFSPDVSEENKIPYLGSYVPVKDELRSSSSSSTPYDMIKYGNEPLFKPLIDYYKTKAPLLSEYASDDNEFKSYGFTSKPDTSQQTNQGSSSTTKQSGDFISFNSDNKHPTLSRLFRDHANYWLFTYPDLTSIVQNPTFLKNKVLISILFNHNFTFSLFGTTITFNPWNEFSEFFSKYSTELVASLKSNYSNFINEIIKSRYGAYFVNRFMDKHQVDNTANIKHAPGNNYWNKPTWQVKKDILAESNKNEVDEGLYWINPEKLVYFHDKLHGVGSESASSSKQSAPQKFQHPERFVIFRPDFLYLIYALLKDPQFQTDEIAPIKVAFHGNVYVPDYNNKFSEFEIKGNPDDDAKQQKGLTASDSTITQEDYDKTPNGDQTYTYIKASVRGIDGQVNFMGIKQDKRGSYVKLYKDGEIINHLLYKDKFADGAYPLIINHYTAKKLEIEVGSTVTAKVYNASDRFTKLAKEEAPTKEVKFRVVEIYDSFYKPAFFISQKNANEILGLSEEYGYNGLYTKEFKNQTDLPIQLTKAISGYSSSNIYARQKIGKHDGQFQSFLKLTPQNVALENVPKDHPFTPPKNEEVIAKWLGIEKTSAQDFPALVENLYGNNYSLGSSIVAIENASLFNDFVFSTVSDLIISVINLFITIFTPLLVFALLVITNLIIEDLKNLLTILNLLGFSYAENSVTILLYLGLVLAFSTFVSLPISSALISLYVTGIFNTLSIFLPIYLRFEYILASFSILLCMFGFSYYTSRRKIKSLYLPVAMKSLNEQ